MKAKLINKSTYNSDEFPARLSWDILREIIDEVHDLVNVADQTSSKTDFTQSKTKFKAISLEKKNIINNMGEEYFKMMRQRHQPYFGQIEEFLINPVNRSEKEKYFEIVDEINTKIAVERDKFDKFEEIFIQILERSKSAGFKNRYSALNKFLSFTYFQCDTGELSDDIA